jgi:hypothetical protein
MKKIITGAAQRKEGQVMDSHGLGYGNFYQPGDAWIEPVVEWVNNKR